MELHPATAAITFDLFGTLVTVEVPSDPAGAVAKELDSRGIPVPEDWAEAYVQSYIDTSEGQELPLPVHVAAALESGQGKINADRDRWMADIERSVAAAFDTQVQTRPGAEEVVDAARDCQPTGILSNCSVPGLVRRTLRQSDLSFDAFDTIVTSVGCGWRKPDRRAFLAIADEFEIPATNLLHVGDDPQTDGGATNVGARTLLTAEISLHELAEVLRGGG